MNFKINPCNRVELLVPCLIRGFAKLSKLVHCMHIAPWVHRRENTSTSPRGCLSRLLLIKMLMVQPCSTNSSADINPLMPAPMIAICMQCYPFSANLVHFLEFFSSGFCKVSPDSVCTSAAAAHERF